MRFIAVIHNWFVHSDGFTVVEMKAKTAEEAETESAVLYQKSNRNFSHSAVKVVELHEGEQLTNPRRLTLRERISGWIAR